MTRFLHSSDWQLGMTRHFLSEEAQARFTQDRIEAVRRLGALAARERAEFVVVAGDVFESNQVERQTVMRALEAIAAIPAPVLLLPGNHDPLDAASVYRSPTFRERRPANLRVLEDATPVEPDGTRGVEVVGAPWSSKRPVADPVAGVLAALAPCAPNRVRVVVGHGAVDALSPAADDPARIRLAAVERALAEARLHYLALGDRHSATPLGDGGAIWYSGAPVATDFDELRPGRALLVALAPGARPEVAELPVVEDGAWRFLDHRARVDAADDLAELARFLESQPHKERTVVRLALVGGPGLAVHARLEALLESMRELFASLELWERHSDLVVVPDALDASGLELSGYARAAWEELAGKARGEGDAAREAREALALFYRLASSTRGAAAPEGARS